MRIGKTFTFDAAHFIEGHPKCGQMHGHTWKLKVILEGEPDKSGFIIDFHDFKKIVNSVIIQEVDHKCLNDVFDFTPTSENIVRWIWQKLEPVFTAYNIKLKEIKLYESPDSWVSYYG